jgi:hypothetical protein
MLGEHKSERMVLSKVFALLEYGMDVELDHQVFFVIAPGQSAL